MIEIGPQRELALPLWPLRLNGGRCPLPQAPVCAGERQVESAERPRVKNVASVRAVGSNRPDGAAAAISITYGLKPV
jgi:hypothetical protein